MIERTFNAEAPAAMVRIWQCEMGTLWLRTKDGELVAVEGPRLADLRELVIKAEKAWQVNPRRRMSGPPNSGAIPCRPGS